MQIEINEMQKRILLKSLHHYSKMNEGLWAQIDEENKDYQHHKRLDAEIDQILKLLCLARMD